MRGARHLKRVKHEPPEHDQDREDQSDSENGTEEIGEPLFPRGQ